MRKHVWQPLIQPLISGDMPGHETRLAPPELQLHKCAGPFTLASLPVCVTNCSIYAVQPRAHSLWSAAAGRMPALTA